MLNGKTQKTDETRERLRPASQACTHICSRAMDQRPPSAPPCFRPRPAASLPPFPMLWSGRPQRAVLSHPHMHQCLRHISAVINYIQEFGLTLQQNACSFSLCAHEAAGYDIIPMRTPERRHHSTGGKAGSPWGHPWGRGGAGWSWRPQGWREQT